MAHLDVFETPAAVQHAPSVDKESKGVGRNGIDESIVDTKFSKCKGTTQFLMAAL